MWPHHGEHRRLPCRLVKEPLGQGWGVLHSRQGVAGQWGALGMKSTISWHLARRAGLHDIQPTDLTMLSSSRHNTHLVATVGHCMPSGHSVHVLDPAELAK